MMRLAVAAVIGIVAAGTAQPAHAYWTRWGWRPGWRASVVFVPPPAPGYYAGPRPPLWVPAHYNRWGRFIPGHWR